jgi:ribA/ribD-fused uncharacterized protein
MSVTSRDKKMRVYFRSDSCVFKKNNEPFGELSNMATIFPLKINGHEFKTSEALYQSCKYPSHPEIQKEICLVKSPMTAKMIGRSHSRKMREDWESVKVKIMRWCLKIKLAQHFVVFGEALAKTETKNIVENSSKDSFWGAIPNEDKSQFVGINALGRLLMELREDLFTNSINSLLVVRPPISIENFKLFNEKIDVLDERQCFNDNFLLYFNSQRKKSKIVDLDVFGSLVLDMVHDKNNPLVELKKKRVKKQQKNKPPKSHEVTLF